MKTCNLLLLLICLLFASCMKQYKRTVDVCHGKLHIEIFTVNPAGVDAQYLTDSVNFRLYVGKVDNEHENFHYMCNGDSLVIEKIASMDTTSIMKVIETRIYNLDDLKKKRVFE